MANDDYKDIEAFTSEAEDSSSEEQAEVEESVEADEAQDAVDEELPRKEVQLNPDYLPADDSVFVDVPGLSDEVERDEFGRVEITDKPLEVSAADATVLDQSPAVIVVEEAE